MTVQPTPNTCAQPTSLTAHPLAQPSPAQHDAAAHWAFYGALLFWLVAVLVDWAGWYAQGVAGVVLGGALMGVSIAQAAQHDRAAHRARRAHAQTPEVWAPKSAAQARATLLRLGGRLCSDRSAGGAA